MKSAYELAMGRTGVEHVVKLTEEQKQKLLWIRNNLEFYYKFELCII